MLLPKVKKDFATLLADLIPAPTEAPTGEGEVQAAGPQPMVETSYQQKGFHLDITVPSDRVVSAAGILDCHRFFIEAITGVDWLNEGQLEVVYDFSHATELCRIVVRTRVDRAKPVLATISTVFPGADWHERETHDFFGIVFTGLAELGPFLLPEDATFHPLLKDFRP